MTLTRGTRLSSLTVMSGIVVCLTVQAHAEQPDKQTNELSFRHGDAQHPMLFDLELGAPEEEVSSAPTPTVAMGMLDATTGASGDPEGWVITVGPYLHLPAVDGEATVAGTTAKLDLSFGDIFDNFDVFGLSGRVEAWKDGQWGIIFDAMYFDLQGDFKTPGPLALDISVDLTQVQIDLGAGLRILDQQLGDEGAGWPQLRVDLLGGGRFQYLDEELTLGMALTLGGSEGWVEPFVGGRAALQINDEFSIIVRGDAGGFGLGDASDLTWNFMAGVGYQLNDRMKLIAGYKVQGFDYSTGSGASQFGGDWTTQGLALAMRFTF